ncbi:MAG: hypothetical protein V7739_14425 [Motiliproteus sp.]
MKAASEKEVSQALVIAERYAKSRGEAQQLGCLALNLNQRLEYLEHLLREVEHYLEAGQEAAGHAHLLRDIAHYHQQLKPEEGSEHQTFGLE